MKVNMTLPTTITCVVRMLRREELPEGGPLDELSSGGEVDICYLIPAGGCDRE
jgi:hypothetical protein